MIVQVKRRVTVAVVGALLVGAQAVRAQHDVAPIAAPGVMTGVKQGGSANVHVVCHIPLGGYFRVMDNEIEQDRPYAYVSQARDRPGFTIVDLRDPEHCKVLYNWRIENAELHQGLSQVRVRGRELRIERHRAREVVPGRGGLRGHETGHSHEQAGLRRVAGTEDEVDEDLAARRLLVEDQGHAHQVGDGVVVGGGRLENGEGRDDLLELSHAEVAVSEKEPRMRTKVCTASL